MLTTAYYYINQIRRLSGLDLALQHQDTIYTLVSYHKLTGAEQIQYRSDSLDKVIAWLACEYMATHRAAQREM